MANINLVGVNGHLTYGIKHFACKTNTDIQKLPKDVPIGSTARSISTSEDYMFDGVNWILQKSSGGGGGEVPHATPEVDGIMKLYDDLGDNEDGTITQKTITESIGQKAEIEIDSQEETLIIN